MTQEFLDYTASKGNGLSIPNLFFDFLGLKPGDKWCLCALRWLEAYHNDVAPDVVLESTNKKALQVVKKEYLLEKAYSVKVQLLFTFLFNLYIPKSSITVANAKINWAIGDAITKSLP